MPTAISSLPTPPSRDNASTFAADADAFLNALPTFRTQLNLFGDELNSITLKTPARLATTANLASLSGALSIDGFTTTIGDRILVKNQTTASQNGVYVAASGAWTRATDFDTSAKAAVANVQVLQGTTNGGKVFFNTFKSTDTLGTTAMTWIDFPSAAALSGLNAAVLTFLTTPSSANLAAAVTNETGTGILVFNQSPTFTGTVTAENIASPINNLVLSRGLNSPTDSIAIGVDALKTQNGGSKNICIGQQAGENINTGGENIAIGHTAGKNLQSGTRNIYIGVDNGASSSGVNNELVFGYGLTGKGSNTVFIGGSSGTFNERNASTWSTTSDQRIKRDIQDATGGLSVIEQIKVRNFRYKTQSEMPVASDGNPMAVGLDPQPQQIGFIAQELQQVLPQAVVAQANGVLSVNLDPLHYHLILAVQQLTKRIEALEAK
jgi:hypothetical protein